MKNVPWKEIAEFVGITAIVLSLLFVGLQLKQSQQLAIEELVNNSNDRQNAIRELIVANPEIWQKTCTGEPLDPLSRMVAAKIFDAWTDHVVGEYILRGSGISQSEAAQDRIIDEFAAQLWIYPGLKELALARREWDNGFVRRRDGSRGSGLARVFERLDELESSGTIPKRDIAWCGRT